MRPFAEVVTRGQQRQPCLLRGLNIEEMWLRKCWKYETYVQQFKHNTSRERETLKKKTSKWLQGMWGGRATWISSTAVALAMAAEMHLWFFSPWVSSKCGPNKATCPCPILLLYPQKNDSHKGERGRRGAVWQSSAPQGLEEVISFAYEDHSAETQPSTASKFHKFLFSLKNSLISWEDSLACNVERKVILPAEAWFVYNVLERLLFVFGAAENSSGCCRQRPCRNRRGEVCSNAGC